VLAQRFHVVLLIAPAAPAVARAFTRFPSDW
jgi:hypothetical protein